MSKRGSCYILNGYFECTMFLNLPIEEVSQVWKAVKELEAGTSLTDLDSLGSSVESSLLLLSLSGALLVRVISSSYLFSSYNRK